MAVAVGKSGVGRNALITGVANKAGIGQTLVKAFLAEGYRVFGTDIRLLDPLEGLLNGPEVAGPSGRQPESSPNHREAFHFKQADITRLEEVKSMVQAAAQFLGGRIHVVINNAGRVDPHIAEGSDVIQEFASFINTNLVGAFNVTAHALEHMPVGQSSVIHMSSVRALQSEPHTEGYAAAKAGLLGLTHAQAMSLAGKVRVNAVLPGWIDTDPRDDPSSYHPDRTKEEHAIQPVGRVGLPADIAHMCIFLSDESKAGFITGQDFVVDGGVTKMLCYD
ncbi:hypothetical protein KFL_000060230 [Klebsormidium nitens]|uniref:Uncharacterized protein n=1 Tax=Klebsormidium nitens TaxID=105231 RepID=A0A0U9HI80_KLENI|nr:hypothetical protein KFL_000060230 [Klebsormidium nitens]|eukprot:GAQ77958.1 hypothetical protein KFL_000060230 [Klebsormidium nitens]